MALLMHPWWTQARWELRRRSLHLFGAALALPVASLASVHPVVAAWSVDAAGVLVAAACGGLVLAMRGRLVRLALDLRYGWLGALPLPARTLRATAPLAAVGAAVAALLVVAVALAGVAFHRGATAYGHLVALEAAGLAVAGLYLAADAWRAWKRPPPGTALVGVRVPLLDVAWLESRDYPGLVAWQHRECTLRWRTGAGAKPVGAVLLVASGGMGLGPLLAILGLVLLSSWMRCALQSSADVARAAQTTLAALPTDAPKLGRALLRLPLASAIAVFALMTGATLAVASLPAALAAAVAVVLFSAPLASWRLLRLYWTSRR